MSTRKNLRIGLSACFFHADPARPIFKGKTLQYLEQSLSDWLLRAGNKVYLIPLPPENCPILISETVAEFDGLVLQGGSDVSPTSYGETPLRPEWQGDWVRDQYEIGLVKEFLRQKKPVLGICRGAQLLNVAFGGSLYQDIESQVPGALVHRNWEIYDQLFQDVNFNSDGVLNALYGPGPHRVNTIHHQAVKKLGQGLKVEAISPRDGIIEAITHVGETFALAVQWHPEFHDVSDTSLLDGTVFLREFMNACHKEKEKAKEKDNDA